MPSAPATTSTYFNPRTPRGVRLIRHVDLLHDFEISIHAPREGCDSLLVCTRSACVPFQSTHPARGATRRYVCTNEGWRFQSTHPARGATVRGGRPGSHRKNFNPRTPRGVRLLQEQEAELEQVFQSTHPARGATHRHIQGRQYSKISIHAPREGCDSSGLTRCAISHVFQSTHPARGATVFWYQPHIPQFYFNPRTPRGVRQQTLPKSREFAWLNLLICTRGRRLSIRKQTRLCSMKLSFMLFGCEPAGEGVSSWTSHATKSKVRLEGRSAYSQSVRSSAHSDFPGNKSGGCPVRDP